MDFLGLIRRTYLFDDLSRSHDEWLYQARKWTQTKFPATSAQSRDENYGNHLRHIRPLLHRTVHPWWVSSDFGHMGEVLVHLILLYGLSVGGHQLRCNTLDSPHELYRRSRGRVRADPTRSGSINRSVRVLCRWRSRKFIWGASHRKSIEPSGHPERS